MNKERMAAFSDGVIAVIITILVLELKMPHGDTLGALRPLLPVFLSYILSFVYIGIYWNNNHHMFAVTERVSGAVLWANLHLLFRLSLVPFVTAWVGENYFAPAPTAVYGTVLLAAALAYWLLQRQIIALHGKQSVPASAVGSNITISNRRRHGRIHRSNLLGAKRCRFHGQSLQPPPSLAV